MFSETLGGSKIQKNAWGSSEFETEEMISQSKFCFMDSDMFVINRLNHLTGLYLCQAGQKMF